MILAIRRGGGIEFLPWHFSGLSVTCGEDNVLWRKTAPDEWSFTMPESSVVVTAEFTRDSVPNNELSYLSVSRGGLAEPFEGSAHNYRVEIPHIFGEAETFFIDAVPRDPNAEITVVVPAGGSFGPREGVGLAEGLATYTVRVAPETGDPGIYSLVVDYAPNLALGSVTLRLPDGGTDGWEQTLAAANLHQDISVKVPWQVFTVEARPADDGAAVSVAKIGGGAAFGGMTLDFGTDPFNVGALEFTVSKAAPGREYRKTYRGVFMRAADFPKEFLAEGGGASIIQVEGVYYEVHTFVDSGGGPQALVFPDGRASVTADYLIVAGGGGAGGSAGPDRAGGGGAGGLSYQTRAVLPNSVAVTVGSGGGGGSGKNSGSDGSGSAIGNSTVRGGGGGGGGWDNMNGRPGGSGGGAGAGVANTTGSVGTGDSEFGHDGARLLSSDTGGGGGGAGSAATGSTGGSPWIATGDAAWIGDVIGQSEFSRGGNGGQANGNPGANGANYGDGGSADIGYNTGGAGHGGIVIIRFPLSSAK
jgi:hypothetical protein